MKTICLLSVFSLALANITLSQQQWFEQNSGVTVQLTSVSKAPVGGNVAWICGYSGTVLRTTNTGQNWLNVSGGIPNTVSLINIFAVDQNTAITAGYTGTNTWVWKTTNAGVNWVQVFYQQGGFINAIWITTSTQGFITGDPVGGRWSLWKTSNIGTNWDSSGKYLLQAGSEAGWNNSLFSYQNKIWFGTNNTRIYYSSNYGTNWIAQPTTGEANSYAVWFSDANEGLTGGATLMRTSNSGTNWLPMASLGTGNFGGITGSGVPVTDNLSFGYIWYIRGNNNVYLSLGGGAWIIEYTAPSGNYRHLSHGAYPFGAGLWAIRSNGGISYHVPIVGIQKLTSVIPNDFKLHQNYPNPFNPVTKIMFDIPVPLNKGGERGLSVKLIIYDVLGREIATVVNEQLKPGTYEVDWDGTNYPSGVYFYKLLAGEYSETRRMVLVK